LARIQEAPPKYIQVANQLRDAILRGELPPGAEIPSERQIVEEWGVSRPTATRALAVLRAEGLVEARKGSGTFVRQQPMLHRRAFDRYLRSRASGKAYTDDERSEIKVAEVVEAPGQVAAALGLKAGAKAIRRKRIISNSNGPIEVSVSWFDVALRKPARRLLDRSRIREGTVAYVEASTGRRAATGRDRIGARLATDEERDDLQLGDGAAAVLVVLHTITDADGDPIEYAEAVYGPDRWSLEQEYPLPG
jgi:GntR family transcriptional regulator